MFVPALLHYILCSRHTLLRHISCSCHILCSCNRYRAKFCVHFSATEQHFVPVTALLHHISCSNNILCSCNHYLAKCCVCVSATAQHFVRMPALLRHILCSCQSYCATFFPLQSNICLSAESDAWQSCFLVVLMWLHHISSRRRATFFAKRCVRIVRVYVYSFVSCPFGTKAIQQYTVQFSVPPSNSFLATYLLLLSYQYLNWLLNGFH